MLKKLWIWAVGALMLWCGGAYGADELEVVRLDCIHVERKHHVEHSTLSDVVITNNCGFPVEMMMTTRQDRGGEKSGACYSTNAYVDADSGYGTVKGPIAPGGTRYLSAGKIGRDSYEYDICAQDARQYTTFNDPCNQQWRRNHPWLSCPWGWQPFYSIPVPIYGGG